MASWKEHARLGTAVAVAFALWTGIAAAAVRVDVLSSPKDAAPGDVVTHVFSVTHDGSATETYALTVSAPQGWGVLGVPPDLAVDAGAEGIVFVTLTVPLDADAGSYPVTLRAASLSDPADEASAGVATRISVVHVIELVPPPAQTVAPGSSVTYIVAVANRGNAQDVVSLSAESARGYAVTLSAASRELSPRETSEVQVTLEVPADAAPGRDVLTLRAASALYSGVEDEGVVFTTILPPGPDAVGGVLYEVLPTHFAMAIEHDETTGAFDSRASLVMSGPVLGGTFAASLSAEHPLGTEPVDVSAYSVSYELDRSSFAIGGVAQTLSDLQSVSCDGGAVSLDGELVDLGLIAGGSDDETRFGGRITVGPDAAQVGVVYTDVRTMTLQSSAWTAVAAIEPLDGWTLRAEGGLGVVDGKRGPAAALTSRVDGDTLFLQASAFSADTYFPGPRHDSAGIEASQRLRLETLSLGLSFAHTWTNVARDPLAPTLVSDSVGANLSATPWSDGPILQATVTLDRDRQEDGTPRDDVVALLAYRAADDDGSFPYAFSGRIADRVDLLLGTWERTVTHSQEAGLSVDGLAFLLTLTEEQVVNLASDLVLQSQVTAHLAIRPAHSPHEAAIEFASLGDALTLDASFLLQVTDDVSVSAGGHAEWKREDPSAASFGWSLGVETTLGIPLPFLVAKGRIEGHVFVDQNADSVRTSDEPTAPGVVVSVEGSEVSTDAGGLYRFPPLAPGRYLLSVRELPRDSAFAEAVPVEVTAGRTVVVDVPLVPLLGARGSVFQDDNQDGVRQAEEAGLSGVRVNLTRADGRAASTLTDARGDFAFTGVQPGSYVATLTPETLPERFSYTTPESQVVDPASGASLLFGGFVRPRQVVVTFQPPTADGTYIPAAPVAGEPVTFDASASFDFDGTLVGYAWDFDADGQEDATDVVATHVFAKSGDYRVTLKVTDNAGNTDTKAFDVRVAAVEAPPTSITPPAPPRPPVAGFSYAPAAPRAGQEVVFDASSSVALDGALVGYAWDFNGDGQPDATGVEAAHVFPNSGDYRVTLEVADSVGNTDATSSDIHVAAAETRTVPVAPPPAATSRPPVADFSYSPVAPQTGQEVTFDAASSVDFDGGIAGFAWDFNQDGYPEASGVSVRWTFAAAGSYNVRLTVTDVAGMVDSAAYTIDVVALAPEIEPAAGESPVARFGYNPAVAEPGKAVRLDGTASSGPAGLALAYAWDVDADGLIDANTVTTEASFDDAGARPVTLTVTAASGESASLTLLIPVVTPALDSGVGQPPIASLQYMPARPHVGEQVLFNAMASTDFDGNILVVAWDFDGDGLYDSSQPVVGHTFLQPGPAAVALTAIDNNGLSDSIRATIEVLAP